MQNRIFLAGGLVALLACTTASAQVSFDPRALNALQPDQAQPTSPTPDQVAPATPPEHPVHPKPPPKPAPHPAAAKPATPPAKPATAATTHAALPQPAPPPKPPTIPAAPPPVPVIPPPLKVPTRAEPPPAPPVVAADAPGAVFAIPDGVRVTFGPERSDLNPSTDTAVRDLVHATPSNPPPSFAVTAYAAGLPEDPSSARRASLSRALTVRSELIALGIPSERIFVRALGASGPTAAEGPADRVDVTVIPGTAPTPKQAPP